MTTHSSTLLDALPADARLMLLREAVLVHGDDAGTVGDRGRCRGHRLGDVVGVAHLRLLRVHARRESEQREGRKRHLHSSRHGISPQSLGYLRAARDPSKVRARRHATQAEAGCGNSR